jgi:hypothetical protein
VHIVEQYQSNCSNRFNKVVVFSDGCAEQYKSSYAAHELTIVLKELLNVHEIVHTFAPTAQFKCCCDSAGNDTKAYMKRAERNGSARANSGWEVFKHVFHMPQPKENNGKTTQFKISKRSNRFVVKEQHLTDEMKQWRDTTGGVLLLRESVGKKKGNKIKGIRTVYQIRASKDMRDQNIMFRNITCACAKCVVSNYDACLTASKWITTDLTPSSARHQGDDSGGESEQTFDGLENVPLLGNMTEHWAAEKERKRKTDQERSKRRQARELHTIQPAQDQNLQRSVVKKRKLRKG